MFRTICGLFFVLSLSLCVLGDNYNSELCREKCAKEEYEGHSKDEEIELFSLWKKFSVFSMENATSVSSNCSMAVENFMKGLKNSEYNALKMFDATGKMSSGILRGNVNQFGDFDECMSIENARYCLGEIDLEPNWKEPYSKYKNFVHSHYAIQETFDDVKHRVPGFTMLRWGFCIPKQCTAEDLQDALQEKFGILSRIRSKMCQIADKSSQDDQTSFGEVISNVIFGILIISTLIGTMKGLQNSIVLPPKLIKYLNCFNVGNNWNSLKNVRQSENDFELIHGIRALNALALLLSHKTMALFYNPYINRTVMTANLGMRWSVIGRTAIIFTDSFMLISGFLNGNSLFKDLDKGKDMKIGNKLITRIFRITPNLVTMILFCTYILPKLGAGPLWPLVIDHHSELCKKFMWRNMLFIHNYFPFENMCLTHTHQVGIDMQLFLATPFVAYMLWLNRKIGLWLIGLIITFSTILRFLVIYNYNLSYVVYFGINISRMFDTANLSYILPTHRATIYFIGVFLAHILRDKSEVKFSKIQLTIFWTVFMSLGFSTWLGPIHMSQQGYVYDRIEAAFYGAFSSIFYGAAVAWTIYATQKGFGGFFGALLSWNKFKYFTKISYAVYLVQFPLFFYNVGKTKHTDEFSSYHMLQLTETLTIVLLSIGLTVFIEIPFQNLKTVIFDKKKITGKDKDSLQENKIDVNQNNTIISKKLT